MKQSLGKLRVDVVCGAVAHRLRFGGGRGQALAKAMGLRAGKTPSVIDATAGLCHGVRRRVQGLRRREREDCHGVDSENRKRYR